MFPLPNNQLHEREASAGHPIPATGQPRLLKRRMQYLSSFTDPHTHIPVLHGADQALERRHGRPKDQHIPNAKITWASLSLAPRDGASLPLSQPSAYSTPVTLPTDDGPGTLLIRASDGAGKQQKGTKISTVVRPEELDVFFARYADVCKAGMGALKKRDRKKRKKVKKGDKVEKVAAP